jgi:hypothetical protein
MRSCSGLCAVSPTLCPGLHILVCWYIRSLAGCISLLREYISTPLYPLTWGRIFSHIESSYLWEHRILKCGQNVLQTDYLPLYIARNYLFNQKNTKAKCGREEMASGLYVLSLTKYATHTRQLSCTNIEINIT